jgi:anti-sigma regulatory factor (Ser/Thr protein kinase)
MIEISLHIIDMVQNAIAANAKDIEVIIEENTKNNILKLEIKDDGYGLNKHEVKKVQDPFFTTKVDKKVGLGIPLLKQMCILCGGQFTIESRKGKGTKIIAQFEKNSIDLPPMGDIETTILILLLSCENTDIKFTYTIDGKIFEISSKGLKEILGEIPFSNPEVIKFLKKYIKEKIKTGGVK